MLKNLGKMMSFGFQASKSIEKPKENEQIQGSKHGSWTKVLIIFWRGSGPWTLVIFWRGSGGAPPKNSEAPGPPSPPKKIMKRGLGILPLAFFFSENDHPWI